MNLVTFIENLESELKNLPKEYLIEIIIQLSLELPRSERNILIDKIKRIHNSDEEEILPLDFELPIDRDSTPVQKAPVKKKLNFFKKKEMLKAQGNEFNLNEMQKQIEKLKQSESIWNRNSRKK